MRKRNEKSQMEWQETRPRLEQGIYRMTLREPAEVKFEGEVALVLNSMA
jgi:hypothetical protein